MKFIYFILQAPSLPNLEPRT